jgi:thiamine biosynthesis protein ThiS
MVVTINGVVDEVPERTCVRDVLSARSIPDGVAIVALNGDVIDRETWGKVQLRPNDQMEIIRIIGGG